MPQEEQEIEFRALFLPLTTLKALLWISIIGIIVFFNMLFNGFVWDDIVFIINNPEVFTINITTAFGNSYFNNSGYYRPLPELYFSLLYALFGQTSFYYHAIQLVIHILCVCLLFLLFKKFFQSTIAFLLALLFLVHPINVESVSYIAASQSVLLFLPGILAVLVSIKKQLTVKYFLLISFLLLLSLFTKETGFFFLLIIFFYTWLFEKKKITQFLIMGTAITGIYASIRFLLAHIYFGKLGYVPISQLSFFQRLENVPGITFYYIKTFFFPWKLAIDQQWVVRTTTFQSFYLPLLGDIVFFALLGTFGVYLYRYYMTSFRIYLFFLLWFVSSFLLLLQIIPLDMTVADRWFYVPLAGLLGIAGLALQQLTIHKRKNVAYACILVVVALFSIRTMIRNTNWQDLLTLYSHDTTIEDNFDNENNLGVVLTQNGDITNAIPHFLKADTLYPTEFTLRDTGMAYLALGNNENALYYLTKSMNVKSYVLPPHLHQTETYDAFARYYLINGNYQSAEPILDKGVSDYPDAYTLWYLKAVNEYFLHNKDEALKAAKRAYELYPSTETRSIYVTLTNNLPLTMKISNQ